MHTQHTVTIDLVPILPQRPTLDLVAFQARIGEHVIKTGIREREAVSDGAVFNDSPFRMVKLLHGPPYEFVRDPYQHILDGHPYLVVEVEDDRIYSPENKPLGWAIHVDTIPVVNSEMSVVRVVSDSKREYLAYTSDCASGDIPPRADDAELILDDLVCVNPYTAYCVRFLGPNRPGAKCGIRIGRAPSIPVWPKQGSASQDYQALIRALQDDGPYAEWVPALRSPVVAEEYTETGARIYLQSRLVIDMVIRDGRYYPDLASFSYSAPLPPD